MEPRSGYQANDASVGDLDGGDDNETEETHGMPPTVSSIPPNIAVSINAGLIYLDWSSNHTG